MATKQFTWNDGSNQKVTVEFTSTDGNQTLSISSEQNTTKNDRTMNINVTTTTGGLKQTIQVIQSAPPGDFSDDFSNDFFI